MKVAVLMREQTTNMATIYGGRGFNVTHQDGIVEVDDGTARNLWIAL
jgi:hypothetical protein